MRRFNNLLLIYPLLIILFLLGLYIFIPRQVQHGILIHSTGKEALLIIDGKATKIKCNQLPFDKYTVLRLKYNLLKAYDFQEVSPISDRVMIKGEKNYDLEYTGLVPLSSHTYFYELDKDNNLSFVDNKKLIIGKDNVRSYMDTSGKLRTFILMPMDYSTMRIAISNTDFSSRYHSKITIQSPEELKIFSLREGFELNVNKDSELSVELIGDKLQVSFSEEKISLNHRLYIQGESMSVTTLSRGIPSFTPAYNGVFELTPTDSGLLLINEIDMEEYLRKVVPSEMPANSALEALKCQAIAARTYAISDMLANRFAGEGYHVDDSTFSQVYNNIPEHPQSNEAVNQTRGLIMTYNGEPIDAKYYSTSAGTGSPYRDVWFRSDGTSDERPYLMTDNYLTDGSTLPVTEEQWLSFYKNTNLSALDSSSPYFRWKVEFPEEALTNCLNITLKNLYERRKDFMVIRKDDHIIKKLPELENLKEIKALKRSDGGNIIQILFQFENASVELSGDSNIRFALKASSEYTGADIPIIRHSGSPLKDSTSLPSSFFSVEKEDDKFIFYGGGYGHGVGMPQYAAMEMGKAGVDYRTILNRFYKNITIDTIY
jgi:stage II sporulation protein D